MTLASTCSSAQSAQLPKSAPESSLALREPFTLKLHVDKEHYYEEQFDRKLPFVAGNNVYLFAGESFGLKLNMTNNEIVAVSYQKEKAGADVELEFKQESEKGGEPMMMLVLKSNLKQVLYMDALMTVPKKKGIHKTRILPLQPGLMGFESWPHPIVQLVLRNLRLTEKSPDDTSDGLSKKTISSAATTNNLLSQIEQFASLGAVAEPSLGESIADGIAKNSVGVSGALLEKIKGKNLTDTQLVTYVWAIGLTKDNAAVDAIKEVHQQSKSDMVRATCIRALATIGGQPAGSFLLSTLAATTNSNARFEILNLLGQMHHEAALPNTEEVLKKDPGEFYWQPIFVFGKMGDKAVPFLLKRINDKDRNIRSNAINVLGQWLIPPEAAKPLYEQFWTEKDTELRNMILSSLERTITDLPQMKAVLEQVMAKEKDEKLVKFAHETLDNMDQIRDAAAEFSRKKHLSATSFTREYAKLFESYGKEGDYEALGVSCTTQDEPQLKALRERILQRDSDEAFYDYQKVNDIIMQNRLVDHMKNQKSSIKPDAGKGK